MFRQALHGRRTLGATADGTGASGGPSRRGGQDLPMGRRKPHRAGLACTAMAATRGEVAWPTIADRLRLGRRRHESCARAMPSPPTSAPPPPSSRCASSASASRSAPTSMRWRSPGSEPWLTPLPRAARSAAEPRRRARPSAPPAAGAAASRPTGRSWSAPGAPPRAGRASCATRSSPAPPSTAPTVRTAPPPSRWSGRARRGCSPMPGSSPTWLWAVCARAGSPAAPALVLREAADRFLLAARRRVRGRRLAGALRRGPRPRPVDGRRGGARAPRGRAGAYLLSPDRFAAEGREHGGRRRLTGSLRAPMGTSRGRSPSSAA